MCYSYLSDAERTIEDSSGNTLLYSPTLDRLKQMAEHNTVKFNNKEDRKTWH